MSRIKTLKAIGPATCSALGRIDAFVDAKTSPNFKYVAALNNESDLSVIRLAPADRQSCSSSLTISDVDSFEWHTGDNDDNCSSTLAVLTSSDHCLCVHEVYSNCDSTNIIAKISKGTVIGFLRSNGIDIHDEALSSVCLLHFENWSISLLINGNVIGIFVVGKQDDVLLSAAIRLRTDAIADQRLVTVASDFVFHLCVAGAIVYAYRLDGSFCAAIDVRKELASNLPDLSFEIDFLTRLAVSPKADFLVIAGHRGVSVCLCLRHFLPSAAICSRPSLISVGLCTELNAVSLAKMSTVSSVETHSIDSLTSKYSQKSASFVGNNAPPSSSTLSWLPSIRKHDKYLTGFRSPHPADKMEQSSSSRCRLITTPVLRNICDLVASHMTVSFWERGVDVVGSSDDYGRLTVLNVADASVLASFTFAEPTYVVLRSAINLPYLILTANSIDVVSVNITQADVISMFMFYENAAIADLLAELNGWECLSMPLNVLEFALRNHQVDAVVFFLKSQEDLSCDCKTSHVNDKTTAKGNTVLAIASLLTTAIMENMAELGSKSFAEHLLHITLTHLIKILQNAFSVKCGFSNNACPAAIVARGAATHLIDLRKHLMNFPVPNATHLSVSPSGTDMLLNLLKTEAPSLHLFWNKWRQMQEVEIIYDAIWNRCVPLAEVFCATELPENSTEPSACFYDKLFTVGLGSAIERLDKKDIDSAATLFSNMGFEAWKKLHELCFNTANKVLRSFLIDELKRHELLTEAELKNIEYLNVVEQIYQCQSFEKTTEHLETLLWDEEDLRKTEVLFHLPPLPDIPDKFGFSPGQIPLDNADDSVKGNYCVLTLESTKRWTPEHWERIILDGIHSDEDSPYYKLVSPEVRWRYLLSCNELPKLLDWLRSKPLEGITSQMVEDISLLSTSTVTEYVLNELAKSGIFCEKEKSDLQLLLSRCTKISSEVSMVDVFSSKYCTLPAKKFQKMMIRFCVQRDLPEYLYDIVDMFGSWWTVFSLEDIDIEGIESPSWFPMLVNFRKWMQNPDRKAMFNANFSKSQYLRKWDQPPTVNEMMKNEFHVMGLVTMLCAPGSIKMALEPPNDSEEAQWKVEPAALKAAVSEDYNLRESISQFVFGEPCKGHVSFYQLLKDNFPFDTACLFGWQTTNDCKAPESFPDLPHFSHPVSFEKYGHVEEMDFTYYLKQGRPSFAYLKFVCGQMLKNPPTGEIKHNDVVYACNEAQMLAVRYFYRQEVPAACVAFMEMLNCDTSGLRIDLYVAIHILAYLKESFVETVSSSSSSSTNQGKIYRMSDEKLGVLMFGAIRGNKSAFSDVLDYLEKAVMAKCTAESYAVSNQEGFINWTLVALFCQRHRSPQSTIYLKLCAEKDNWFMFSLFAEVHAIPKKQVLQMIKYFPPHRMTQHLTDAFYRIRYHSSKAFGKQSVQTDVKKTHARDPRANLYAKLGVPSSKPKPEKEQSKPSDVKSDRSKTSDNDSSSEGESGEDNSEDLVDQPASSSSSKQGDTASRPFSVDDIPSDIIGLLQYCSNFASPWKSLLECAVHLKHPVLSILAVGYQEASTLDCLCVYLLTNCRCPEFEEFTASKFDDVSYRSWSLEDLKILIVAAVKLGGIRFLVAGFNCFQPESPFNNLFRFVKVCIIDRICEEGTDFAKEFHNSMSKITESNPQIIGNQAWFQETVAAVMNETLLLIPTPRQRIKFLEIMNFNDFLSSLMKSSVDVANYTQLHDILEITVEVEPDLDVNLKPLLLPSGSEAGIEECNSLLDRLLTSKEFVIAYKFVAATGLPNSSVVIAHLREEISVHSIFQAKRPNLMARLATWDYCSEIFKNNNVANKIITEFFTEYGLKIQLPLERFYVLQLAWNKVIECTDWQSGPKITADQDELEREMWLARIAANVRNSSGVPVSREEEIIGWDPLSFKVASPATVRLKSSKEVLLTAQNNSFLGVCRLQSDAERVALDKIIGEELDNGHIDIAYRVSQFFDHKCPSLNIVLTCLKLAEGTMALHEIDVEMRILLEKGSTFRPFKLSSRVISSSSSRNSFNTGSFSETPETRTQQTLPPTPPRLSSNFLAVPVTINVKEADDVLAVIEKLVNRCEYGVQCCARIGDCYSIANALGLKYIDIVENYDDSTLLKVLLQSGLDDRFFLAREYLISSEVDDEFVASFLCEHIINALRVYKGYTNDGGEQPEGVGELILKPTDSDSDFVQLAKLCREPSLLGSRLLDLTDRGKTERDDLSLDVDLCIRAHSCFTVCCDVEGIARTLRKAKKLCRMLTEATEFSLLVKLLIGIRRFSEMTYAFHILRENHQFELLLRKGMEKVPDLKMALLDYIRRFHPTDTETFTMIALHFCMYREIASMLETDAKAQMKVLDFKDKKQKQKLTDSLENIMQLLADAAESYLKVDCMQHSFNCTKQAELVALQIFFMKTDVQVMALSASQVSEFIVNNKFYESLIVADAYSSRKDWAQALYNNFVVKNDEEYLQNFQDNMEISLTMVEEIARRYKMSLEKTPKMTANMKQLLHVVEDLEPKYDLAVDLGFDDFVSELLKAEGGSYLKDIIRKRKYNIP